MAAPVRCSGDRSADAQWAPMDCCGASVRVGQYQTKLPTHEVRLVEPSSFPAKIAISLRQSCVVAIAPKMYRNASGTAMLAVDN
jgi:hypothetical protein